MQVLRLPGSIGKWTKAGRSMESRRACNLVRIPRNSFTEAGAVLIGIQARLFRPILLLLRIAVSFYLFCTGHPSLDCQSKSAMPIQMMFLRSLPCKIQIFIGDSGAF